MRVLLSVLLYTKRKWDQKYWPDGLRDLMFPRIAGPAGLEMREGYKAQESRQQQKSEIYKTSIRNPRGGNYSILLLHSECFLSNKRWHWHVSRVIIFPCFIFRLILHYRLTLPQGIEYIEYPSHCTFPSPI